MEFLSNIGEALDESLVVPRTVTVMISSDFTVFAYGELKDALSKVDELRFVFSEPTFVKRMQDTKEPMEFELKRRSREQGIGGTGLELILRNNLNQRALAKECAEWIRNRASFKSAKHRGAIQPGGTYYVDNANGKAQAFMGASADFTLEGLV